MHDDITKIEAFAFENCTALKSVVLPLGIIKIESNTFEGCTSLESVEIPMGVTSIGFLSFGGCTSLTNVEIPFNVVNINEAAFSGCTNLKSFNVDSDNTKYSSAGGVLYNKDKTEIVRVPESFEGIFEIPSTVMTIGEMAFEKCNKLTSVVIPSSVREIKGEAFVDCIELKKMVLPSNVSKVGYYAFKGCKNLDVIIENKVDSIKTSLYDRIREDSEEVRVFVSK